MLIVETRSLGVDIGNYSRHRKICGLLFLLQILQYYKYYNITFLLEILQVFPGTLKKCFVGNCLCFQVVDFFYHNLKPNFHHFNTNAPYDVFDLSFFRQF